MAGKYKAFLFDLNGTMIDDMEYHIRAWYRILNDLGADISMEETKQQCYGKNHELIERVFPGRFSDEEKERMSLDKEKEYQEKFRPRLKLIPGLDLLLRKAEEGRTAMAIGSAAIRFNIDFVLDGLQLRDYFSAIVSADDVKHSKPDPETYNLCAEKLGISPEHCLVFEDSPKGTEAAQHAGMDSVVITTMHRPVEFDKTNVIKFISRYDAGLYEELAAAGY